MTLVANTDIDTVSAFFAATLCAILFNPWDRALYLSSNKNNRFFSKENFNKPFHGFPQAILQRGAVYLLMQTKLEHSLKPLLRKEFDFSESAAQLSVGVLAGGVNGLSLNSIIAIKHHTWGDPNRTFSSSVQMMWAKGGYHAFLNGVHASALRGVIYGGVYEVSRKWIGEASSQNAMIGYESQRKFFSNWCAAMLACIAASPIVYMRSIQHATEPGVTPPTMRTILNAVWMESKAHHTVLGKACFFPRKFKTWPGITGASLRMAVSQQVCDATRNFLTHSQGV